MSRNCALDWPAVSALLLEGVSQPILILGEDFQVCQYNSALEKVLGWARHELYGRSFLDACIRASDREKVAWTLREALRGVLRHAELTVSTKQGQGMHLTCDLARVGQGRASALLVGIRDWRPAKGLVMPGFAGDIHYEICIATDEESFGIIRYYWSPDDPARAAELLGKRCYEALYGRETACEGCPAFLPLGKEPRKTVVRHDDALQIVTAQRMEDGAVRMGVRRIEHTTLSELIRAKLDTLAEQAGLSSREKSVLELLVMGRSAAEIAQVLRITTRTDKYHQANILEKLGADSRLDLMRLLL